MKVGRLCGAVSSLLVVAVCQTVSANPVARSPEDPEVRVERSRAFYKTVMPHLEPGGDLLMLANVQGVVKSLVEDVVAVAADLVPDPAAVGILQKVPLFLEQNGFFGLAGYGASTARRRDGLFSVRQFIARDPVAARKPLWRLLFGGDPRRCESTGFLVAGTEFAAVMTMEIDQAWPIFTSFIESFAASRAQQELRESLAAFKARNQGVGVDALLASLSDELFLSVTLDANNRLSLPLGPGTLSVARPGVLIGLKVKDDKLLNFLLTVIRDVAQTAVIESKAGEMTLWTVQTPQGGPMPVQPTFVMADDFLLFGHDIQIVKAALAAKADGAGRLSGTEDYQQLLEGMPAVNNGFVFCSRLFAREVNETVKALQRLAMSEAPPGVQPFGKLVEPQMLLPSFSSVRINERDGVFTRALSTTDQRQMLAPLFVGPAAGIMAWTALPAVSNARTKAMAVKVQSDLGMLETSIEMVIADRGADIKDQLTPATMEAYVQGGVRSIDWPEGVLLMEKAGEEYRPIPGGAFRGGRQPSAEAWQRFLRSSAKGPLGVRHNGRLITAKGR